MKVKKIHEKQYTLLYSHKNAKKIQKIYKIGHSVSFFKI